MSYLAAFFLGTPLAVIAIWLFARFLDWAEPIFDAWMDR